MSVDPFFYRWDHGRDVRAVLISGSAVFMLWKYFHHKKISIVLSVVRENTVECILWSVVCVSLRCEAVQDMYLLKKMGQGMEKKGDCDSFQDDRFSGDQGVFTGWKQFVLLANSVYQHGIADLCLGAVNSRCGRQLSRHVLKY